MVSEDSFVGEHTPLDRKPEAGSAQHDLAVVKGRQVRRLRLAQGARRLRHGHRHADCGASGKATFTCDDREYTKHAFEFAATESTDKATLAIEVEQKPCLVGTVSLMPADNVQGMRADTLAAAQGTRTRPSTAGRAATSSAATTGRTASATATAARRARIRPGPASSTTTSACDEFMTFCRLLNTEPYIAVNSGLGGVENAVEELQYANGAADTPMGAWRARNGHPEPYSVKWWGIGNEMYGDWQLGHMPLEEYVEKHNVFAEAMRGRRSVDQAGRRRSRRAPGAKA